MRYLLKALSRFADNLLQTRDPKHGRTNFREFQSKETCFAGHSELPELLQSRHWRDWNKGPGWSAEPTFRS